VSLVAKVFVVLNLIISVAFLVFAMNVWTAQTKWQKMYEKEKVQNVDWLAKTQKNQLELSREVVFQQQNVAMQKQENITLRLDRNRIRDEQLSLQTKIAQIENEKSIKEAENQELSREKQRYFDEIIKLKSVVTKQQQAVIVERENAVRARNEKSEIENELNVTKQTLAALQRDKRTIEEDLALQTRRIEGLLDKGVPIYRILGEDPSATQAFVPDAQVLAVRGDIGLVMISVGSQQGVKPGYQFTVSRGSEYVGKVQVEKVYPDMCSARLVPGTAKGEVQVHDEAHSK
jgi:hypothetical protein